MNSYFENPKEEEHENFPEFSPEIRGLIMKYDYVQKATIQLKEIEDEVTFNHSIRMAECANYLCGRELFAEFSNKERENFILAALLHDLGKTNLDPDLLKKKNLSPEEKAIMDEHARQSFDAIKGKNPPVAKIVVMHHEFQEKVPKGNRQNGNGNGNGNGNAKKYDKERKETKPETVSLAARLAIIDAFHSMIDPRRKYRPNQFTADEATEEIWKNPKIDRQNKKILPEVVEYFAKNPF
jgi:HD-GYP domain-containing protein (c-di-GMP phosphodiesterase class II)